MTRYDVRCGQAPWENTTTDLDSAIDLAYSLSEEYQCDVNIHYNHTGTIYTTVSNYWWTFMSKTNSKSSWIDELIKWENAHPEYKPFKEDKDSQRQQNLKENY